jgi:hypothetical protein
VPALYRQGQASTEIHVVVFVCDSKILTGISTSDPSQLSGPSTSAEAAPERIKVVSLPNFNGKGGADWTRHYRLRDGSVLKDLMRAQEAQGVVCHSIAATVEVSADLPVLTWSEALQVALGEGSAVRVGSKRARASGVGDEPDAAAE